MRLVVFERGNGSRCILMLARRTDVNDGLDQGDVIDDVREVWSSCNFIKVS
jgi:hypothetical protein